MDRVADTWEQKQKMTNEKFHQILERYLQGIASEEEEQILQAFYQDRLGKALGISSWTEDEKLEAMSRMQNHLHALVTETKAKRRIIPLVKISSIAAAVLMVSAIGYLIINYLVSSNQLGQVIPLSYITKTAERGQKLSVTLSDGSIVKLNAESSVTYPESFIGLPIREIELKGEAFFEVSKDVERPFRVTSGELVTSVLGTSFNINAYPGEEKVKVTVVTGKVQVEPMNSKSTGRLLTSGQQAVYHNASQEITKEQVNLEKYTAWKDNKIIFDDLSFNKAVTTLERWFDVKINFENPDNAAACYVSGKFENETLENILDGLKFMKGFEYEMQKKDEILITGKTCN